MGERGGAVAFGGREGDLELARQVVEFGVKGGPLARDFAVGAWVYQFVGGHAGQVIGGDIAYAVAGGLDRMHLHAGEFFQDVRHFFQLRPVELHILAGGEVAVALVVLARDPRQHPQLVAADQAVGHGDTQHRREALQIQAIAQPQRTIFLVGQLAGQVAFGLVAELRDALVHQGLVVVVVLVHAGPACRVGAVLHCSEEYQRSRSATSESAL